MMSRVYSNKQLKPGGFFLLPLSFNSLDISIKPTHKKFFVVVNNKKKQSSDRDGSVPQYVPVIGSVEECEKGKQNPFYLCGIDLP